MFSARDAYVWPSDGFPGNNKRVATYPFFGHHANRNFEYIICDMTFPADDPNTPDNERTTWINLIEIAFEQWQKATDNFITVTRDSIRMCAQSPSNMAQFIAADDRQNEVRMFDLSGPKGLYAFPEFKSDVFKICIDTVPACVTSFDGYSGLGSDTNIRNLISNSIQSYLDGEVTLEAMRNNIFILLQSNITFLFHKRQSSNVLQSVDVSFKKGEFPNPVVPGLPVLGSDKTRFNTCLDNNGLPNPNDNGGDLYTYATAVHEAGHALGLSNISTLLLNQRYHVAHPTTPDAVMNYDSERRGPSAGVQPEPDCSPHPFDIMAIYALYQKVR